MPSQKKPNERVERAAAGQGSVLKVARTHVWLVISLNDNIEEDGKKINGKGSNGIDKLTDRKGNDPVGQNVQGSEPRVQAEASRENGTKKP